VKLFSAGRAMRALKAKARMARPTYLINSGLYIENESGAYR